MQNIISNNLILKEDILTDWDKGWLSGLIDGEGSLYVGFCKQKTSSRPRVIIGLSISNNSYELLERAKKVIGGGSIKYKKAYGNRKEGYQYFVHANRIRIILPQLDLIVKKKQKELCLEGLSMLEGGGKGSRKGFHGGKMRPIWKDIRFSEIKKEMNILNKRGRNKADPMLLVETHVE